jgi:predicted Zn-dependent protease
VTKFFHRLIIRRWFAGLLGLALVVLSITITPAQTAATIYPLPDQLAQLADNDAGDYFEQLNFPQAGALIWTAFPVKVFVDSEGSNAPRKEVWLKSVQTALNDWRAYFDLVAVRDRESANIIIRRRSAPLQYDPKTKKLGRFRLAETRFELFFDTAKQLRHRMTIDISPNQADAVLLSGARHEIGHALGIWGHSDRETDLMYFSQTQNPAGISQRDLNTLKKVYRSATRIGT